MDAVREIKATWKDRIFTPLVTLWVFLGQVLNADQSCRAAVARLIAHRVSLGLEPCSSETGAYCQARKRLPERFFAAVARLVGRNLDAQVDPRMAVEGPPRLPVRRVDGLHARHAGEPARVPADLQPGARDQLRHRADRGRSSRSRAGRSSTWASAATPARARGRSACCASCGTCSAPATCCWGTA